MTLSGDGWSGRSLWHRGMRATHVLAILACAVGLTAAQEPSESPTDAKAQATYKKALDHLQKHETIAALDAFKKADKQDSGHCLGCQKEMITCGIDLQDWKAARAGAEELLAQAKEDKYIAVAHYQLSFVIMDEALHKNKQDLYAQAHDELVKALASYPNFPQAIYADGQVLAHLNRDEETKARFEQFVKMTPADDPKRQRALRFIEQPDLARARMAPAFSVTTLDGQHISIDDLQGKVVLLDFWATWCGPCRAAMPRIRDIARRFQGQPLVVLSVNLDNDQAQWKKFVSDNGMTWLQYSDGGFGGPIAHLFNVHAIPHTFTIDADGVLQDEQVGDAAIEGKLKRLIARAQLLARHPQ